MLPPSRSRRRSHRHHWRGHLVEVSVFNLDLVLKLDPDLDQFRRVERRNRFEQLAAFDIVTVVDSVPDVWAGQLRLPIFRDRPRQDRHGFALEPPPQIDHLRPALLVRQLRQYGLDPRPLAAMGEHHETFVFGPDLRRPHKLRQIAKFVSGGACRERQRLLQFFLIEPLALQSRIHDHGDRLNPGKENLLSIAGFRCNQRLKSAHAADVVRTDAWLLLAIRQDGPGIRDPDLTMLLGMLQHLADFVRLRMSDREQDGRAHVEIDHLFAERLKVPPDGNEAGRRARSNPATAVRPFRERRALQYVSDSIENVADQDAAQNDLTVRMASGEIDTEAKKNRLIDAYIDELSRKLPEWENLQVSVVAGA